MRWLIVVVALLVTGWSRTGSAHDLAIDQLSLSPDPTRGELKGQLTFDPALTRPPRASADPAQSEAKVLAFVRQNVEVEVDGAPVRVDFDLRELWTSEGEELAGFQQSSLLPDPLPPYTIPTLDYVFGYSLWIAIALVAAWVVFETRRNRRARQRDAELPLSYGPPLRRTDMDRWLGDQLASRCVPGEELQHQAYVSTTNDTGVVARASAKCFYAGLTSQRLILLATREGALGLLREVKDVTSVDRGDIASVAVDDEGGIVLATHGGTLLPRLLVRPARSLTPDNQVAFRACAPRILQAGLEAASNPSPSSGWPATP